MLPELKNHELTLTTELAKGFIQHSKADNTIKAYSSDWKHFLEWCERYHLRSLPAEPNTIALYISSMASTHKPATIQRKLSSIRKAHDTAQHASPVTGLVMDTLKGIRRSVGTKQHVAAAAELSDIRRMVEVLNGSTLGQRDRALLLIGFAGAFRRSELVALNVEDLEQCAEGLRIHIRRSKTDQEAQGFIKAIPFGSNPSTCPIRSLQAWIETAGITEGALFRSVDRHGNIKTRLSDKAVALVVKRSAEKIGLNPAIFSGHSLRAGFVTTAAKNGEASYRIKAQTGHKSDTMINRYIRSANIFDNASCSLGL